MTWIVRFHDDSDSDWCKEVKEFDEKPTTDELDELGFLASDIRSLEALGITKKLINGTYWTLTEFGINNAGGEEKGKGEKSKPVGYHLTTIEKSEYGTVGKVSEELSELIDAIGQDCKIMMLVELSDLVGAIEALVPQINVEEIEPLNVVVTLEDIIRTVGLIAQQPQKLEENCVKAIRMIYRYVYNQTDGFIERKDLNKMSDITKRAFKNGERK